MKRIMAVMVLALLMLGFQAPVTAAAPMTVIDFEGLADSQIVDDYYHSTYGVTFAGAQVLTAGVSLNPYYPPHSGSCVVYDYPEYADPGTITITFSTPYTHVGAYFTTNTALTFTAYDSGGNPVGQDLSLDQANWVGAGTGLLPNHYLYVDYAGGIAKVVIEDFGNTYTLDDLTFGSYVSAPANVKYLHAKGGWMNITSPIGTQWHELWPFFCKEYHLSGWEDNGDGILSHCDWIDIYEKPDGALKPYHVEDVTITLNVTLVDVGDRMFIELEGGYNASVLKGPVVTRWHEIYPFFCKTYYLMGWSNLNINSELDAGDMIWLLDAQTEEETQWFVEDVAVDIIVTPEPPPVGGEAYPVSKACLLAPWIALGVVVAGGISCYVLRRRRARS